MSWNKAREMYVAHFGDSCLKEQSEKEFPARVITSSWGSKLALDFTCALMGFFFRKKARKDGARITHTFGVVGHGTAVVVEDPTFPSNDLFQSGKSWPVYLRHANISPLEDDAALNARGAALRFLKTADSDAPDLDLLMNTGKIAPIYNAITTPAAFKAKAKGAEGTKAYFKAYPSTYVASIDALRRRPDSYHELSYYTQIPFYFKFSDPVGEKLVKFRLLPKGWKGDAYESGLPSEEDQRAPWNSARSTDLSETDLPLNYLREAFKAHLSEGELYEYVLQMQIHDIVSDEEDPSLTVWNSAKEWDLDQCPFHDVCNITLSSSLSDEVAEKLSYNIANVPQGVMRLPSCRSKYDYRSIHYMRTRAYRDSQHRLLNTSPQGGGR